MAGFKDYKGTPFVPFILPIIPRGEPLSPDSKLTPEKLGKIPGLRDPDTGQWAGIDWKKLRVDDGALDIFATWYAQRPGAIETVGVNARELIAVDSDSDNMVVAMIVRETANETLGVVRARARGLVQVSALLSPRLRVAAYTQGARRGAGRQWRTVTRVRSSASASNG